jgi:hypothetical protein
MSPKGNREKPARSRSRSSRSAAGAQKNGTGYTTTRRYESR